MEKIKVFETSGLVKNPKDLAEIEFWGHDAGEFFEEILKFQAESEPEEANLEAKPEPESKE